MKLGDTRDERGTALILAMVFLLVSGIAAIALGGSIASGLANTSSLQGQRSVEYAADAGATIAVQNVRYNGQYYGAGGSCLPPTGAQTQATAEVTVDGVAVVVDCVEQLYDPVSGVTRVINVYACAQAVAATAASCTPALALVTAQVTFDDYSTTNTYQCMPGGNVSTCGTAMTIDSWVVGSADH